MDSQEPTLIHIRDVIRVGGDPRAFRSAADAGHFIRIRRGVYASSDQWSAASDRERHIARVRAVFSQLRSDSLAAGYSAAAVHGLPTLRRFPAEVTLLTPYRGGGTAQPGIRRTAARWCEGHGERVLGIPVTNVARTIFDLVLRDGVEAGVATIDSSVRGGRVSLADLHDFVDGWRPRTGEPRFRAALALADPASESFGESMMRVVLQRLGFATPQLQVDFVDDAGLMRVDFFWPEAQVVAEFDGRVKFAEPVLSGGDPADVLWREKQREDRLRRLVRRVVRVTWDDVRDSWRLTRLLDEAGVPRVGHPRRLEDTRVRVSSSP